MGFYGGLSIISGLGIRVQGLGWIGDWIREHLVLLRGITSSLD